MKTKLLAIVLLFSVKSFCQSPIISFYGDNGPFIIGYAATPLNHTASGANANWNFNLLIDIGTSNHVYRALTPAENTNYPNTTSVMETTRTMNSTPVTSQLYTKASAGVISITGVKNPELELNYNTNNGILGTFPLNYGFTNTDTTAGTYIYGEYTGTFTGTITNSVDAYGTLNANIGNLPQNASVTRMKTVQNVTLNYGIFTGVGTGTQTAYTYYYNNGTTSIPLLRSGNTQINVALLGVNENITDIELYNGNNLSTSTTEKITEKIQIAPNPAADLLHIFGNGSLIKSVTITDLNGRVILSARDTDAIDVSGIQKGVYFARITTDAGASIQQFIKQ